MLSIPRRGQAGGKFSICLSLDAAKMAASMIAWDHVAEPERRWKVGVSRMVT